MMNRQGKDGFGWHIGLMICLMMILQNKYIAFQKDLKLQSMQRNQQLLSFWIGPASQRLAHHFYALQAQQIFQDQEDPLYQQSLWEFKDKDMLEKYPKMMVFDTASDHLVKIRKVNHKKILKKMKTPTKEQAFFNFQVVPPQDEQEEQDPDVFLYSNWKGKQDNYVLIDKKFNDQKISYNEWENIYKYEEQMYEDKIRKKLQKQDYLSLFTLCTDGQNLGFTQNIIYYLKEACYKKPIITTNISDLSNKSYFGQSFIPLLGNVANEVQLLVDIENKLPKYLSYDNGTFYDHLSPIVNSIYTPFILKNSNSQEYLQKIDSGNRNLYNIGCTLPIIDEQEHLNKETNIFQYIPKGQEEKIKKKKIELVQEEKVENRINYVNTSFLNIFKEEDKKKIRIKNLQKLNVAFNKTLSESYVLKGHFKQINKYYNQNSNTFEIKYLRGVFASNPHQILKYNEYYQKDYGEVVENFPLHTILYQHSAFGPSIRNFVKESKMVGFQHHELVQEWRQNVLTLSDKYGEEVEDDQ